jgi:hypothetical protein
MINYTSGTPGANPCYTSPTAQDLNSVECDVYKFCAGVRVALGDVDGDGCDEVITAPGSGLNPWVRIWDALVGWCITSTSGVFLRAQFLAYADGFEGGVYVAAGNVDGSTARDEIITGAGPGGGPHVRVFSLNPSTNAVSQLSGFYAYSSSYTGGVRVGAGEVDCSDSYEEILTAPGSGHTPTIKTWNYPSSFLAQFDAYSSFNNGVFVADGDVYWLDCGGEIVTGPDGGGGAHLRSWKGPSNVEIYGFYVFSSFGGGVRVGSGQLYGDAVHEIIAGMGPGGNQVKVTDVNGNTIRTFSAYTPTLGVFVAGGQVNGSGEWEIATGADAGGGPHVRIWTCCSATPAELTGWMAW